ncbi:serine hydroxymethyltransferase, partial [Halobellus rarus]
MDYSHVRDVDPAVADALSGEVERQQNTLAMIASENHASEAVLEAQGSALTNKYAEGYPGERYYAGCAYADEVEELAIERAEELWGA